MFNLLRLPPEVISHIIGCCSIHDLVTLCRVSKAIQVFSTRTLYRDLSFNKVSLLLKCCRALIKRELSANSVRSFRIELNDLGYPLFAFYRILENALRLSSKLQDLRIDNSEFGFQLILSACHFPCLFYFQTRLRMISSLTEFIYRHSSTITGLHLDGELLEHLSFLPEPVNLPLLTSFSGNPVFVHYIQQEQPKLCSVKFSALETLTLTDTEASNVVNHLREIAGESLECVSVIGSACSDPLPKYIAKYLNSLRNLGFVHLNTLVNEMEPYIFSAEDLCEDVKLLLPEFQQLERLILNHVPFGECHTGLSVPDSHKFVTDFHTLCPKLKVVLLPNKNGWHRCYLPESGPSNVWMPDSLEDIDIDDALWLFDMLFTEGKKDPSCIGKVIVSATKMYLEEVDHERRINDNPNVDNTE
ncbi:hypothetical protein BDP27DRAFT_1446939 [Rhodocollybia butyracea]|uniref:F-box domain-containing protein n=1 Tax=Rhodocollybia butyracea TaxID=206335 RepID=A0A9P5PW82_9AGAR|nr:hypothetical protein BDP27DRAFT_1446939 [Rhodocollybia butyracea]